MIEKIGKKYYENISNPDNVFVSELIKTKQQLNKICVAEIGIGIGATSKEIYNILDDEDEYYIFDYDEKIKELKYDLEYLYDSGPKLHLYGNSKLTHDSYAWSLYNIWEKCFNRGNTNLFDLVFLDGAHDFVIDYVSCSILMKLLNQNGAIIIDNPDLKYMDICNKSVNHSIKFRTIYSDYQLQCSQLNMVIKLLLSDNESFEIKSSKNETSVIFWRKL
ncbi:MAG TPA: hypothetical protein DC024_08895 [Clostridiales bacterium]|jgi:hypothetical protein|nr:hypothetical protein [Clostridiales bacterium]